MRGTFKDIRIGAGVEGGVTVHYPSKRMPIYDAAMKRKADGCAAVVFAGKEYGSGSSRDWACSACARWLRSLSSASTVQIWSAWV